jgi:hypothetical protein
LSGIIHTIASEREHGRSDGVGWTNDFQFQRKQEFFLSTTQKGREKERFQNEKGKKMSKKSKIYIYTFVEASH